MSFVRDAKTFCRCDHCDLVFVSDPEPEYWSAPAYLAHSCHVYDRAGPKPAQLRDYDRLLDEMESYRRTGRLLEVGCGAGLFLREASRRGWMCSGVDLLPEAVEAGTRHGLDVRCGELSEAGFPEQFFDVVYMNEVIEHVLRPVDLMREVHRVLRPGGLALLRTGNARSWAARLRGAAWPYYRFGPLLHVRFYSPRAAAALGRAAGFARVHCRTRGFALRESAEIRGRWYKPAVKLAQALVSPLAGPFQAGHRLTIRMWK